MTKELKEGLQALKDKGGKARQKAANRPQFEDGMIDEWEEETPCGHCKEPLTLVKPGKHQCENQDCPSNKRG